MPFKISNSGFTLIELLVSIGIILMVTAVAIPSLRDFNNTQSVDNAASQLMNVLKQAQSSAVNRIRCPVNNENTTSWEVALDLSGTSDTYSLISNCQTALPQTVLESSFNSDANTAVNLKAETDADPNGCGISASQGVNLSIFFTNQQVSYLCSGGTLQTAKTLRIKVLDSSGKFKYVVVEPGGVIRSE